MKRLKAWGRGVRAAWGARCDVCVCPARPSIISCAGVTRAWLLAWHANWMEMHAFVLKQYGKSPAHASRYRAEASLRTS